MNMQHNADRLYFADNLRIMLVMLVVAHHAGQAYAPTGGFWPLYNAERVRFIATFFRVNAAFFMGLLFLIAGFFTAASFSRKSGQEFWKSRFMRIGIPLFTMSLFLNFPVSYAISGVNVSFVQYVTQLGLWNWQVIFSHLWFLGHLLVYAAIYVVLQSFMTRVQSTKHRHDVKKVNSLKHWHIITYAGGLLIATTLIRLWFPMNRWIFVGVPVEPAHLPQYVSLFLLGTLAFHHNWFKTVPANIGMVWFWIGMISSAFVYVFEAMHWSLVFWELWEVIIAVGLSIGLLTFFREHINVQGTILKKLSSGSYGVYIFHIYIVLGLQAAVHTFAIPALAKFIFVTIVGIALSYTITLLLKMIPGVKKIL
jgi:hypothetical protein